MTLLARQALRLSESELQREIMVAVTAVGGRVFRNNTGMGWTGQIVADIQTGRGRVVSISNPRPLHTGLCVGSSDLIGWYRGRFLAIECKTQRGRISAEQQNFISEVNRNGGIGIIARSVADVLAALRPVRPDVAAIPALRMHDLSKQTDQ